MAAKKIQHKDVDCLVVGGGPAGIYALRLMHDKHPEMNALGLVEAGPSLGGRAKSALHLIDSDRSGPFPLLTGTLLAPPLVRWERQWIAFSAVDWDSKEWVAKLPQWELLGQGLKTLLMDVSLPESDEKVFPESQAPVYALNAVSGDGWELLTPEVTYRARRVVWAAGLKPFQNALGKQEAQAFLVPNPDYSSVAADFRGGVGLDVELPRDTEWEDGFRADGVCGVPGRVVSKRAF